MKIEIKQYDTTYSVENKNDDLDIHEIFELLIGLLKSAGYSEISIKQAINEIDI